MSRARASQRARLADICPQPAEIFQPFRTLRGGRTQLGKEMVEDLPVLVLGAE